MTRSLTVAAVRVLAAGFARQVSLFSAQGQNFGLFAETDLDQAAELARSMA